MDPRPLPTGSPRPEAEETPTAQVPDISIIIPAYNAAGTIGRQLEALQTQVEPPRFEVLVVDNGSTDDLRSAIAPYVGTDAFDLRLIRADAHQGSSFARNAGAAHARADIVQFCDADDVVGERWVINGYLTRAERPLWTGVSIVLREAEFDRPLSEIRAQFRSGEAWEPPLNLQWHGLPGLLGGNFGADRELYLEMGGFDQAAAHFGDDNDLALRLLRAGHEVWQADTMQLAYRGKFSLREQLHRARKETEARKRLIRRHGPDGIPPLRPWPEDLVRTALSTLRAPFRRDERSTPMAIASRWAWAFGNTAGSFGHVERFDPARPGTLGLGLDPADSTEVPL